LNEGSERDGSVARGKRRGLPHPARLIDDRFVVQGIDRVKIDCERTKVSAVNHFREQYSAAVRHNGLTDAEIRKGTCTRAPTPQRRAHPSILRAARYHLPFICARMTVCPCAAAAQIATVLRHSVLNDDSQTADTDAEEKGEEEVKKLPTHSPKDGEPVDWTVGCKPYAPDRSDRDRLSSPSMRGSPRAASVSPRIAPVATSGAWSEAGSASPDADSAAQFHQLSSAGQWHDDDDAADDAAEQMFVDGMTPLLPPSRHADSHASLAVMARQLTENVRMSRMASQSAAMKEYVSDDETGTSRLVRATSADDATE
jgi:hypothetical protein